MMAMMSRRQYTYLCLALFVGLLLNVASAVGYARHVDQQRQHAERVAQQQRAAQNEATRKLVCDLANGYLRTFAERPPEPGTTGEAIRHTWQAMANRFLCPPP